MNFQLFKIAQDNAIKLPRIDEFCRVLTDVIAPSYAETEPEHPELESLALLLSRKFAEMDFDTPVFDSISSLDPAKNFNSDLSQFKMSELRGMASKINNPSVTLSDENIKALLNIVLQAAIFVCWHEFTIKNPSVLVLGAARGLSEHRMLRLAADEKKPKTGRKTIRLDHGTLDLENPLTSQGLLEHALISYNAAFNALVVSSGLKVFGKSSSKEGARSAGQVLRSHSLLQMVENLDFLDAYSQYAAQHRDAFDRGVRSTLDGTVLLPDPIYGPVVGGNHLRWSREGGEEAAPNAIFAAASIGQSENALSKARSQDLNLRQSVFGRATRESDVYGSEHSAIGAHKRAVAAYRKDTNEIKNKVENFLVKGFLHHIYSVRVNGLDLAKWSLHIPGLKDTELRQQLKVSLANVVAGIPTEIESLSAAAEVCDRLVKAEEPKYSKYDALLDQHAKSVSDSFFGYVAQLYLHLPTHFYSQWANFDFREALTPIPEIAVDQGFAVGTEDHSFSDLAPLVLSGLPATEYSAGEVIFDRLQNLKNARATPAKNNLLILARYAATGQIPINSFADKLNEFAGNLVSASSAFVADIRRLEVDENGKQEEKGAVASIKNSLSNLEKAIIERPSEAERLLKRKAMLQRRLKACEDIEELVSQSGIINFVEPFAIKTILSICSNPDDDKVVAATGRFVAGGATEEDKMLLASAISGSFPEGKFNIDSVSQEHSNYNTFSKLRSVELDQNDEFHVYENASAIVPEGAEAARYSAMYNSTQHYVVDQLKREHNARTYAQNKIELEKIIKSEYPLNPEDAGTTIREQDIQKKISELLKGRGQNNILARLGLEELITTTVKIETDKGMRELPLQAPGVNFDTLREGREMGREAKMALEKVQPARVAFLKKLQEFFYKNTKSSIIQTLKSTPMPSAKPGSKGESATTSSAGKYFDESYYDALMVLLAQRCGLPFEHDIAYSLFHRFGEKASGPTSVADDSDKEEKGIEENILVSDAVSSRKSKMDPASIAGYANEWLSKPRFRKDGKKALHPYSLPGFFSEILAKKEILEDERIPDKDKQDVAKFLREVFADPGKSKSFYNIPIFGLMKARAAFSLGKKLHDDAGSQINAVLRAAAASDDPSLPKTRAELVERLTSKLGRGFTNPIIAMKRLARGDAVSETHGIAFERLRSSMGSIEKGNYPAWEKEALRELAIFVDRNDFEIQRHPSFSAQEKVYLSDLARSSKLENAADIEKEAYSAEDVAKLRALSAKLAKPTQKASVVDLYNVLDSDQFVQVLNGPEFQFIPRARARQTLTKERIADVKKAIKSSRNYKYAFEYELNLGRSPVEALKNVLLNLRGPALGLDESGSPFEMNKDYAKQAISYSRIALEQAARQPMFDEFLQEWVNENQINEEPAALKESVLDNKDFVARFEQLLFEELGSDYQAIVTSVDDLRALVDILIRAWKDVQGDKEQLDLIRSSSAAVLGSLDEMEKDAVAVDLAATADAKTLASLISDVCEANTEMRVFMTGILEREELERKIMPSDAPAVREIAARTKAMPLSAQSLKTIQEGIIDGLIAKPASISSQRYRDMVEAGDTGRNVRTGLRQQANEVLKRQLSSAGTNLDIIADRLENAKAAAPAIKASAAISNAASADGGASALIADGKAILNANIFYSNISVSTSKFYSVFADNLERKIKEWVPQATRDFPNLIKIGDLALSSAGLPKAGTAIDVLSKLPVSEIYPLNAGQSLSSWQTDIVVTYIESRVKEGKIAEIRADIAKIPSGTVHELQAWRQATATKEEDLDKLRPSSFPLTLSQNADVVSEEAQRLTPDDDDDASIASDERKAREQSLAQVSVQIKDLRRALDLARGVADSVRTQGKRLINLFEKQMLSDNSIVNVVDQAALDSVANSIKDAVSVVRSAKKEKLSSESNSVFADLLLAVNSAIGKDNEIVLEPSRIETIPTPAEKAVEMDVSAVDKELKKIVDFVNASRDYVKDPGGLKIIARLSQLTKLLADGQRKVQSGADIAGAVDHLKSLNNVLIRGGMPSLGQLDEMLDRIHRAGVLTDEFKEDELEISEDESAVDVDIMAGFDAELDGITRLLQSESSRLSEEVKSALTATIDALSPSNRRVEPDADIASAIKDLKVLESALRAGYDLRPDQIEVMVSGLRTRGIEAGEVPSAGPPPAQSGVIAPEDASEEDVLEIDEGEVTEVPPAAESGKIAPDEEGPIEISEEDIQPIEEPEAQAPAPAPAPAPVAPVYSLTEAHDALHQVVEGTSSAAKAAGAVGETANKLSTLVGRLGAMLPPTADTAALPAQLHAATETAKAVQNLVTSSVRSPTWKAGSELPHMPELDKLIAEVDQIMSPTRRASRSLRFVRTGDSWLI